MNQGALRNANIAATTFLLLACFFAYYRWTYAPRADDIAGLEGITDGLRASASQQTKSVPAAVDDSASMPQLLSKVQEVASGYGVSVRSVTPSPTDPEQITLGVDGDFRNLMLFLGRLETLHAGLSGFDIAPATDGSIGASIDLLHSAKPGAPASFADYMDAIVNYTAVRNPFEIGDPVPLPNAGSDLGDISWTYHLTSISQIGAERTATIDGKDYRIGDLLADMTVTEIAPSSVSLTSPKSAIVQKLHFRHNPGGADAQR